MSGIVSARNFGLSKAKGTYVAFVDQDDLVDKYMYEKCIDRIVKDNSEVCICECDKLYNSKKHEFIKVQNNCVIENETNIKSELVLSLLCKCNRMKGKTNFNINSLITNYFGFVWNAVYKRSIIKENDINFIKFVAYEDDHLFILNYLSYCKKISFHKHKGYFWRIHASSVSHTSKYFLDLSLKLQKLSDYYLNFIKKCITDEKQINYYKDELYIRIMINIVKNETLLSNPKSDRESIKYLEKMFQELIVERNINLKRKTKFNWNNARDEYIRNSLGKYSLKYIFYINKYIYNKVLLHFKNIIKK